MSASSKNLLVMNFQNQRFEANMYLTNILNKENTPRFIVVPVGLFFPTITTSYLTTPGTLEESGHSNLIVIDNYLKEIVFFEPHGDVFNGELSNLMDIPNLLYDFLTVISSKYNGYHLVNASDNCLFGLQEIQNMYEPVGHCLAWSMLYLHLRLLNPEIQSDHIIQYFTNNFSISEQLDIIRMYIATIEDYYYSNQEEYLTLSYISFKNTESSIEAMTNRLSNLVVQYKILLNNGNFVQASSLFEELLMYRKLPLFHQLLMFLGDN
jgi:hypothetical protein